MPINDADSFEAALAGGFLDAKKQAMAKNAVVVFSILSMLATVIMSVILVVMAFRNHKRIGEVGELAEATYVRMNAVSPSSGPGGM